MTRTVCPNSAPTVSTLGGYEIAILSFVEHSVPLFFQASTQSRLVTERLFVSVQLVSLSALKTIKQEESIARSRFAECPVCKNHTLKIKKTVQVGRCKSCSETYKVIVVFVKTGRKTKIPGTTPEAQSKPESKAETTPESSLPSWQQPSDSSLFGSTASPYSGLSEAIFGQTDKQKTNDTGSSNGQ